MGRRKSRGWCLPRGRERGGDENKPELKPTKLTSKRFSATAEKLISNLGLRLERLHGPDRKKTQIFRLRIGVCEEREKKRNLLEPFSRQT